ncbi:MAG: polysaccharide biosynthesis C-terminal domain-containing protein [Inhella sp.]
MLKHTLLYLGVRALNGLLALATLALLSRWLSAEDYGRWALGQSLVGSAALLLFQWAHTAYGRLHRLGPALDAALLRLWAGLALLPLLAAAAAALWRPERAVEALALALGVAGMGLFNFQLQRANASGEPLRYGRLSLLRALAFIALAGLAGAASGVLMAFAAAAWLAALLAGPSLRSAAPAQAALLRPVWQYGGPQLLGFAALALTDSADRLILHSLQGPAALAGYAAAADLMQQTLGVLLSVVYLAGFPKAVQAYEAEPASALPLLARMAHLQLLLAGAFLALVWGAAPGLAALVFGPGLAPAAAALMPWLATAAALAGLRLFLFDLPFQLQQRTRLALASTALVAGLSVAGHLLLVPRLGALGAAWALLGALLLGAALSYARARQSGLLPAMGGAGLRVLLCTLAAAALLRALPGWPLALQLPLGLLLFGGLAWLLDAAGLRQLIRAATRIPAP